MTITHSSIYPPFGSTLPTRSWSDVSRAYRYGFNGKEKDSETANDNYDFGARIYDGRLGRWLSLDPLMLKYPFESSYSYVGNQVFIFIDPCGKEKIVVSGGEYNGDGRYKFNFIEPAINQLKAYKAIAGEEQVTWAIMNVGYTEEQINSFQSTADELGVKLVKLNSAEEFTRYINQKDDNTVKEESIKGHPRTRTLGLTETSGGRNIDKLSNISIFSHGTASNLEFGYNQVGKNSEGLNLEYVFKFKMEDIKNLNPNAFNNQSCIINLYSCNSATPTLEDREASTDKESLYSSFAGKFATQTKTMVTGYQGKTDYSHINDGESNWDKLNRYFNDFNTNGSKNLPQAGKQKSGIESKLWSFDKRVKDK